MAEVGELADGVGAPFKIIGDEFDSSVVFGIIHHHSPHGIMITIFLMKGVIDKIEAIF